MQLINSLLLLALSGGALARHGHQAHHEEHARRQADVSTLRLTNTVYVCPCEDATWTSFAPTPTTTSTTIEPTTTSSVETSTTSVETWSSTSTSSTSTTVATTSAGSSGANPHWTSVPSNGEFSTAGFGGITNNTGSGVTYAGNVGNPYGSNIQEVHSSVAGDYKHVLEFTGSNTDEWTVVVWNKIGKTGKMDGWYGNACHTFTIAAGEVKYLAFDEDTQSGFAAAKGSSIPTDKYGGYAATWGELDLGSTINSGWSGFDVSAIQAQNADLEVQGMRMCSKYNSEVCSSITSGAGSVNNAYTAALAKEDGIGGNLVAGPVRIAVTLDYSE
ncbi:uncharacterized protein N7459_006055 [Penicillium hispanicum]|uniref:uncharacterized protein n=1 Tax=Penicillium hispanicum TaxID=1080232 RepID=UPI0025413964|nr:uncharacterized protein N7459_006055 [Penicillium hispanicum]KAJ5580070.1 hypothetical protein N7459_006055 [Penicillium hispanicum]